VKPSVIVAVALAVGICFAPRCEGQQRPAGGAQPTAKKSDPPAAPSVPYEIENQWIYTETQPTEKQSPQGDETPEWALVIVGIITFGVIGWQSWETRKTANAAIEANAESKQANTETLAEVRRQANLMEQQASLMRDQLKSSEAAQAAQLVIEELSCTIVPGPNFQVKAKMVVRNVGATVAHNISLGGGGGSVNLRATTFQPSDAKLPPNPSHNGPSLAPEKFITFEFGSGDGPTTDVEDGHTLVFVHASVSYTDIFSKPHITTANKMYDRRRKEFVTAPHKTQRE
jgi:hypothetical protein